MSTLKRESKSCSGRYVLLTTLACLGLVLIATMVKAGFNWLDENGRKSWGYPRNSAEEAEQDGMLVYRVEFEPQTMEVNGQTCRLRGGWVEEASDDSWRCVWIPTKVRVGGYFLVLHTDIPGSEADEPRWILVPESLNPGDPGCSFYPFSWMRNGRAETNLHSLEDLPDRLVLAESEPHKLGFRILGEVQLKYLNP